MATTTAKLILPGDRLPIPSYSSSSITLGPGTSQTRSRYGPDSSEPLLVANKMGLLGVSVETRRKKKRKVEVEVKADGQEGEDVKIWVDGRSRRYIPAAGEAVLGTIFQRMGEGFRVDIGSAQLASLDGYAFEGASKKNKPKLEVGTLVYARVSVASRDMEPEVECINPATMKADGYGELKGGLLLTASLRMCRNLLTDSTPLSNLASLLPFPFEITIGFNGRIWINTSSVTHTIALKRILEGVDEGKVSWDVEELKKWIEEEHVSLE